MFCQNCGKELDDNAAFCGECGAKVEVQNQMPVAAAPVQPTPVQPQQNYGDNYQQPGAGYQQYNQGYQQNPYQQNPYQQNPYQQPPYMGYSGQPITFSDFFTANGRLGRMDFFKRWLILFGISILLGIFTGGIGSIFCAIAQIFISIRRLHDLNKSGWNLLVGYVSGILLFMGLGISFFGLLATSPAAVQSIMGVAWFMIIAGSVVGIWALIITIQVYFVKGTDGPNQYGPDPLVPPNQMGGYY